jgi:LmbE family N-acetylglucosaminyl deacetylase
VSDAGPLLVVVAHPDDEALGFAGVIAAAVAAGRRVRVAVVTNGDSPLPRGRRATVRYGIRRGRESIAAARVLGLRYRADAGSSDVWLLGYPNGGLAALAAGDALSSSPRPSTYAAAPGLAGVLGRGDLRYRREGRHSPLTRAALERDLDLVVELADADEVYTHAAFDGHPDHAALHDLVLAALQRRGRPATMRTTLIHPAGTAETMYESAYEWPNPELPPERQPERFTPGLAFEPPPTPDGPSWGPDGPPHELVEVPAAMLEESPERNLKWRAIACFRSQLNCVADDRGAYHPSCGYLRAFVKRHEFFWVAEIR